jgi:predicted ATPase/DNA-binding CsgD family transcriptional regulator
VQHDRLVAEAIAAHDGSTVELGREGDSVLAVFRRARDAAAAALALQASLERERWPEGLEIRVRVAIHTGRAKLRGGHYYGHALHLCARLLATAHGGQVLLSPATEAVLAGDPPDVMALSNLGVHRLKDVSEPLSVFELVDPDRPRHFPPLRSQRPHLTNLPAQLNTFVNRERELVTLRRLLRETRLLTLTGVGGCGKTSLALELGAGALAGYPDGVWLVDLTPISDASLIPSAAAGALGVREQPGAPPLETLARTMRPRRMLLVLDNCEHLVEHVASLAHALLQSCPTLTLIATSRERLGVTGELVWPLEPMEVPVAGRRYGPEELTRLGAVALFLSRARQSSHGLGEAWADAGAVGQLVRRLEGLPLAIVLAAGWCGVLSPEELLLRLSDPLRILTTRQRTTSSRHSSLRAAIDSSYGCLMTRERWLFRRLGPFAGGWSLASMEEICELGGGDGFHLLAKLVDCSLVTMETHPGEPARYRMLDSLRKYAVDKLREMGELEQVSRAFGTYFLRLAETAAEHIFQPVGARWLEALDTERDNWRAALQMGLDHDPGIALRLAGALDRYWDLRGSYVEGQVWLTKAIQAAPVASPALAAALRALAHAAWAQGDQRSATRHARTALAVADRLGDGRGMVLALQQLARIRFSVGDLGTAKARIERALPIAYQLADQDAIGICLFRLGLIAMAEERWREAEGVLEESIRLGRAADDVERVAVGLAVMGRIHIERGRLDQAEATLREGLTMWRHHGSPRHVARLLESMAALEAERGQHERAAWLAGAGAGLLELAGVDLDSPIDTHLQERVRPSLAADGASSAFAAGRAADMETAIRHALAMESRSAETGPRTREPVSMAGLTRRELTVARLVAKGMTDPEIAAHLSVAESTVEVHLRGLHTRLGLRSRIQIASWAAENLPP